MLQVEFKNIRWSGTVIYDQKTQTVILKGYEDGGMPFFGKIKNGIFRTSCAGGRIKALQLEVVKKLPYQKVEGIYNIKNDHDVVGPETEPDKDTKYKVWSDGFIQQINP